MTKPTETALASRVAGMCPEDRHVTPEHDLRARLAGGVRTSSPRRIRRARATPGRSLMGPTWKLRIGPQAAEIRQDLRPLVPAYTPSDDPAVGLFAVATDPG